MLTFLAICLLDILFYLIKTEYLTILGIISNCRRKSDRKPLRGLGRFCEYTDKHQKRLSFITHYVK